MAWRFPNRRHAAAGSAVTACVWLVVTGLVLAAGPASFANYATYMRIHGDWVVLCGFDETTAKHWCELKAPPPALGVTRSVIRIQQDGEGGNAIKVRIGHPVDPDAPIFLRIDANAPRQTQPTRTGEVEWRGDEAAAILAELGGGRALTLRSFPLRSPTGIAAKPFDEWYSLALFNQALLDLKSKADR